MWNKAIFKLIDKETGEVKINYRGLRDLGLFLYKYQNNLEQVKDNNQTKEQQAEEEWSQSSFLDILDNSEEEIKNDNKKWVLSSEGEPDFPPNSEEEANYIEYLEELEENSITPIEEHDHYRR